MPSLFRMRAGMTGAGTRPRRWPPAPGSGAFTSATLGSDTSANSLTRRHSPTCKPRASAASPKVASVYGGA